MHLTKCFQKSDQNSLVVSIFFNVHLKESFLVFGFSHVVLWSYVNCSYEMISKVREE